MDQSSRVILVVDDEASIRELVKFNLEKEGYRVVQAASGPDALAAFRSDSVDLIILDLMLPGIDGLEVCREIRKASRVPIIMLTAKDTEIDEIVGLEVGADDYVTKPFSPRGLVARVRAMLRRSDQPVAENQEKSQSENELTIDEDRHLVKLNGNLIDLTPKEFELLAILARHPGRVFRRDLLLDDIWGYEYVGDTRTVDVHVRRLRKKIEEDPANPQRIITVHGIGYKFQGGG